MTKWVLVERERFQEVRLRALETLCESHLASGDVTSAITCASTAVRADPLRESSRRMLIGALIVEGNRAQAFAVTGNSGTFFSPWGWCVAASTIANDLAAR